MCPRVGLVLRRRGRHPGNPGGVQLAFLGRFSPVRTFPTSVRKSVVNGVSPHRQRPLCCLGRRSTFYRYNRFSASSEQHACCLERGVSCISCCVLSHRFPEASVAWAGMLLLSERGDPSLSEGDGLSMRDYSFHFNFVPEKPCSSLLSSWRFHVSRRSPIVGFLCSSHTGCGRVLAWIAASPAGKPFKQAAA